MGKGIFKDFWIKLVSVAIAIALWFFVNSEKPRNITFNVPLTPSAIPSGVVVKEIFPDKVKVIVRGKFTTILSLDSKAIRINLPFTISRGDTEVSREISSKDVVVPSGIEFVKVEPNKVLIKKGDAKKGDGSIFQKK